MSSVRPQDSVSIVWKLSKIKEDFELIFWSRHSYIFQMPKTGVWSQTFTTLSPLRSPKNRATLACFPAVARLKSPQSRDPSEQPAAKQLAPKFQPYQSHATGRNPLDRGLKLQGQQKPPPLVSYQKLNPIKHNTDLSRQTEGQQLQPAQAFRERVSLKRSRNSCERVKN